MVYQGPALPVRKVARQLDTLVGTSIGGYTLVKLLGAGGMGSVYLATDPAVGQQVAVKLIRTELDGFTDSAAAQLALERFRQEARAVAGLDHLHILPLNRYGEEQTAQGPRAYMIMQYRPEGSLWDWLRRRADIARGQSQPTQEDLANGLPLSWPLSLTEATDYLQQAASALQYAHDRGIVHRDIKPANFMLRFELHEKRAHLLLGDFGLAKVFTGGSSTQTILGTPTYMAPEQFEGAARPESDQYALAVMIYYLLAGRPPFEGDPMQLMRQHLTSPVPSITSINPEIPPTINGVLVRALAKPMEQRFPSIATFADTFAQVAKQVQSGQSQISMFATAMVQDNMTGMNRPGMGGLPQSPASAQQLVLPGPAEGMGARGYNTPLPPMNYPQQAPMGQSYASPFPQMPSGGYTGQQGFTNAGYGNMYAQQQAQAQFTQAPGLRPGYQPQSGVSQSGTTMGRRGALGWILGGTALLIAAGGAGIYYFTSKDSGASGGNGPALQVLKGHTGAVNSVSLSTDGSQLVTGSSDGTARVWATSNGAASGTIQAGSPVYTVAWSPDGSKIATGEENHSVDLWKPNGSSIKRENGWSAAVKALAWRSDGALLFLGTNGSGLHALQLSNYKHLGSNKLLVINALAISPDGNTIALALESGRVVFADLTNGWAQTKAIEPAHGSALSLAWSHDNSFVVAGYADGQAIVYDAASQQAKYLLKHKGAVNSVAWAPNSSASTPLLVSGAADGTVNIWNLGSGTQTVYTGHSDAVLSVTWGTSSLISGSKDMTAILWQLPNS